MATGSNKKNIKILTPGHLITTAIVNVQFVIINLAR